MLLFAGVFLFWGSGSPMKGTGYATLPESGERHGGPMGLLVGDRPHGVVGKRGLVVIER